MQGIVPRPTLVAILVADPASQAEQGGGDACNSASPSILRIVALGQSHQFLDRLIHQPGDETKRVVNGIVELRLAGEAGDLRKALSMEFERLIMR
jgi:hypothetical protein